MLVQLASVLLACASAVVALPDITAFRAPDCRPGTEREYCPQMPPNTCCTFRWGRQSVEFRPLHAQQWAAWSEGECVAPIKACEEGYGRPVCLTDFHDGPQLYPLEGALYFDLFDPPSRRCRSRRGTRRPRPGRREELSGNATATYLDTEASGTTATLASNVPKCTKEVYATQVVADEDGDGVYVLPNPSKDTWDRLIMISSANETTAQTIKNFKKLNAKHYSSWSAYLQTPHANYTETLVSV